MINPAKSNLGTVSKQILDKINASVRAKISVHQWRNTDAVIEWFNNLTNKQSYTFVMFDIVDFYPSISETLLINALDYASQYAKISEQDIEVIMHARKALLFDGEQPWSKKDNSTLFAVTMRSCDGAEVCEMVGPYALHKLKNKLNNEISDCIGMTGWQHLEIWAIAQQKKLRRNLLNASVNWD